MTKRYGLIATIVLFVAGLVTLLLTLDASYAYYTGPVLPRLVNGDMDGMATVAVGANEALGAIYVDTDATGAATGLSWTDAYTAVQDALAAAASGDEIWVAKGVYTPGAIVSDTFTIPAGIALYGGFAATETVRTERDRQANPTILSGDIGGDDITDANGVVTDAANISGANAYHVVTGSGVTTTAVLDGFTITAGQANGSSSPLFVTPVDPTNAPTTAGDLRLQAGSPAIDAGDNSVVSAATDLDGEPRIVDGDNDGSAVVDMGAYEGSFPDLAVTITESTDPVVAGSGMGNLTYTVTVENLGAADASGVALTDTLTLPAGVTLESVTPGGSTTWDGNDTWTVGDLAAGAGETLTLTLTVGPSAGPGPGLIANQAAVTAVDQSDTDATNDSATEATSVDTAADLVVTKADTPDPVAAGGMLTYTVAITNNGPSDARNVFVTDIMTDALTLDSTTGCAEDPNGAPICTLGTVPAGSTAGYTMITVVDSTTLSTTITNIVTVSSTTAEAAPGDESTAITTTVHVIADLELSKIDTPDPVMAGEPLTYTLTITNHGPSQGWGVKVDDTLPLSYNHTGNNCGVFYSRPDPFEWIINDMPAGQVLTCVITGTVDPGVSGTITNTAFVNTVSFVTDPDPSNSSLDEPTTVYENIFAIGNVTQAEGSSGATPFTFIISRTGAATAAAVDVATVDDTAVAGQDYTAVPTTTVNFAPGGSLTQTVTISVAGDTLDENDETFFVLLSNPANGAITDGQGVGTILDDDAPPQLSVDDPAVGEGSGVLTFTVSLDAASSLDVSVDYATGDGTAVAPGDYTSISGTLSLPAGTLSDTLTVPINDDALDEVDETFTMTLSSPANATLGEGTGAGTIVDDDTAVVDFDNASYAIGEGEGAAMISVTLSTPAAFTVTAAYTSGDGTAAAGIDYTPISGAVDFAPGQTIQPLSLPLLNDTLGESDETVILTLTHTVSATLGTAHNPATLTILDDDDAPVETHNVYLPLITGPPVGLPDLVVADLVVTGDNVMVWIANEGAGPVIDAFWVDAYLDPDPVPTQPNQTWSVLADEGLVWGVTAAALPLEPGETLALTVGGAYYDEGRSVFGGAIPAGTPAYAQVDSANANTTYGAVLETHEAEGGAYNNVAGPVAPPAFVTVTGVTPDGENMRGAGLPPRPQ